MVGPLVGEALHEWLEIGPAGRCYNSRYVSKRISQYKTTIIVDDTGLAPCRAKCECAARPAHMFPPITNRTCPANLQLQGTTYVFC
jgi:hypothetical protein